MKSWAKKTLEKGGERGDAISNPSSLLPDIPLPFSYGQIFSSDGSDVFQIQGRFGRHARFDYQMGMGATPHPVLRSWPMERLFGRGGRKRETLREMSSARVCMCVSGSTGVSRVLDH